MTKEELENQKLQSEIDKNNAEQAEIEQRTQEIEKRLNQRKIFGVPIYQTLVGGIVAGVFIITFSWKFLTPILNKDAEIAKRNAELFNIENKLEQARLASLNKELTAQKRRLEEQVQLITARQDSTVKQKENERKVLTAQLKLAEMKYELSQEEVKSLRTKGEIIRLTAQISKLDEDIRNTKSEKEQLRTIVPANISYDDATRMIKANNYYDKSRNPNGLGIENEFELQRDGGVYDAKTRLTWQQSGSTEKVTFEDAQVYIEQKNRENYGGYSDWRLPTLKEAMSLMSPDQKDGIYIDPLFDKTQKWIWTADKYGASLAWVVGFYFGYCGFSHANSPSNYVRAVR